VVNSGVAENVEVSLSKGDDSHLNKESINDNEGKVSVEELNYKTGLETVVSDQDKASPLNGGSENNSGVLKDEKVNGEDTAAKGSGFSYGEKERERFNKILNYYVGTHNFHNFTTRIKPEDPSAHRFIISFDASTTVVVEGMEFVKCEIVGQSFMLHQIRKMMGLAVAIMRNCAPESLN
jgi:tRNA pseudouridine38-40 synthase